MSFFQRRRDVYHDVTSQGMRERLLCLPVGKRAVGATATERELSVIVVLVEISWLTPERSCCCIGAGLADKLFALRCLSLSSD